MRRHPAHAGRRPLGAAGLLLALLAFAVAPASAQRADWGDLPPAHTGLAVYEADTSAAAVVLFDVGEVDVKRSRGAVLERHRRVKLFREAGYDQATVSLVILAEGGIQRVRAIEGQTFAPDGAGGYRRVEMDGDAVFRERLGANYERITFTLPALAPGAIVEYRYELVTEWHSAPPTWHFQEEVPVLYSELTFTNWIRVPYAARSQGGLPYDVEESGMRNTFDGDGAWARWVRTDVPALREEPLMTARRDHVHKIEFEIGRLDPGAWRRLAEALEDHPNFGEMVRRGDEARDVAEAVTAGLADPLARLRAVYASVSQHVRSTGKYGWYALQAPDETLASRSGSVAEVNLLLARMLRAVGIEAQPALLSTRGYGRARAQHATLDQFNYVIVRAVLPDSVLWLDATDPLRPVGLLHEDALRQRAWIPTPSDPRWVDITAVREGVEVVTLDASLSEDGALAADLRLQAEGYAALALRRTLREDGLDALVGAHLVPALGGAVVDTVRVEGLDDIDAPLHVYASLHVESYAQRVGELLLVNPLVLNRTLDHPFTAPERTFPVDFAYARQRRLTGQIRLPDGFVVDELPESVRMRVPGDGADYACTVLAAGDRLVVRSAFRLEQTLFGPEAYPDLRAFYDRMAAEDRRVAVLRRKEVEGPHRAEGSE